MSHGPRSCLLAASLAAVAACGDGSTAALEPRGEAVVDAVPDALPRPPRRMDIDQLKASMEQVSGGIGWTVEESGETVDRFEQLSVTLGKPDYLASTHEDLTPGILFQKFLDDAAKSICRKLVEVDPGRSQGERALLVHAEVDDRPGSSTVELNLRAALLRWHGHTVPAGSPELEPWLALHEQAHAIAGGAEAWNLVCVSLYTHPDFYAF